MSPRIKSEALADKAVRAPAVMVLMRDSEIVEAIHEPQRVGQTSCLFGAKTRNISAG